ncbi:MAG: CpsD/CapB family tyrosine-protein kinase [Clostridia bacterium]|nr:CpsD/CapB family tyrosine-protein kinase [Clostridia bacterium]
MKQVTIGQLPPLDYAGAEALNSICTNLTFAGRNLKKILITSNDQSDGKSWMTIHIAINLAQRGRRVLLIDSDLRRSFLVQRYKMSFEGECIGLAHYLTGQCDLDDCVYESDQYGMCLIPAGRDVTNPVSLLDTPYFADTLNELAKHFDVVLLDAPPVGIVIDAAEMASCCDGSVLVVEHKKTRVREIAECKRQMEQSGTPVLGCIINKVTFAGISEKRYYNRSYYRHYQRDYRREDSHS